MHRVLVALVKEQGQLRWERGIIISEVLGLVRRAKRKGRRRTRRRADQAPDETEPEHVQ